MMYEYLHVKLNKQESYNYEINENKNRARKVRNEMKKKRIY